MSVICPACQTENRDAAMFCHGCARKLPNFVPTQPSMLETMRTIKSPRPTVATATIATPVQIEPRSLIRLWIGFGSAVLVLVLGIGAWYVFLLRKPPPSPPVASRVERPIAATPPAVVLPDKPKAQSPETIALGASLAPGESEVAPARNASTAGSSVAPQHATTPPVAALTPSPPHAERRQPPRAAPSPRVAALDPRNGCETLNFVFAARCEAAHCDKPQYAKHPRCDLVREERRRAEIRRNPTLAF